MKRIEQLKALSLEECRLLMFSILLLPIVALSLRMRGYNRTQNSLRRLIPIESDLTEPTEPEIAEARIVSRMVAIAAGHGLYRANCLKQSLVLWWLLSRRGIKSEVVLGAQKDVVDNFNAHAWVECNGINLSDSEEIQQRFAAFQKSRE